MAAEPDARLWLRPGRDLDLLHAVERPVGTAEVSQLHGQRVLCVGVFAAAAFQNQADSNFQGAVLMKVNRR